jgi:drug/metabolite transporter (DMT)-like permease
MSQGQPPFRKDAAASLLPIALLVVLGLSWGLHFPILKFAARSGLPYSGIAAAAICGVALALLSACLVRRRLPAFGRGYLRFYLVCALLGYLAPYFLALFAAGRIDAGMLTLIGSTSPIFTLCLAALVGAERITAIRVFGILLGAVSVAFLILPQASLVGVTAVTAMVAALGIPLSYSSYHVYLSKYWPAGSDSFQVACGEALTAVCLMTPIFLFAGGTDLFASEWGVGHWAILATVVITTLDCYLYFEIVRLAGPVFVSQGGFIAVIAGVLWGMLLHGEKPSEWLWVSLAFLIGSLFLLALSRRGATLTRGVRQTVRS